MSSTVENHWAVIFKRLYKEKNYIHRHSFPCPKNTVSKDKRRKDSSIPDVVMRHKRNAVDNSATKALGMGLKRSYLKTFNDGSQSNKARKCKGAGSSSLDKVSATMHEQYPNKWLLMCSFGRGSRWCLANRWESITEAMDNSTFRLIMFNKFYM